MERTNFENLQVYKLAEELADAIWEIASKWDRFDRDTIGKQIVRSADSVGANIAEGVGDTARKTISDSFISHGSLYETKHWLRRAYKRKLLNEPEIAKLPPIVDELAPKLNAYFKSISKATNHEQRSANKLNA